MSRDNITDFGVGCAALTVPLWVQHLTEWAQVVVILGSAALVLVRLFIVIRRVNGGEEKGPWTPI